MWLKRHEEHARKMIERFRPEREAEEAAANALKQISLGKNADSSLDGEQRKRKAFTPKMTPEQEAILRKRGASTSIAARELNWSVVKVQRYAVELGIVASTVFLARKGKKGRPRSEDSARKSARKQSKTLQDQPNAHDILVCTPEQKSVLRKHGANISLSAKELGWPIRKTQRYAAKLGLVASSELIDRKHAAESTCALSGCAPNQAKKPAPLYCTSEQESILRKYGVNVDMAARELRWSVDKVQRYASELGIVSPGTFARRSRNRLGQPRQSSDDIDDLMRRLGRQVKKVATLIGWPVGSVANRMDKLGVTRDSDELRIAQLLTTHKGCSEEVALLTQRTASFVDRVRSRHGISKPPATSGPRNSTAAWDKYISLILALSVRKANQYLTLLRRCLPATLSSARLSAVTGISRKTINKYLREGWLPSQRQEFVLFLESQIAFTREKKNPLPTAARPTASLGDLALLRRRANNVTSCEDLRQEITNDAVVRILSGLGEAGSIDLEMRRVKKSLYPTWGKGSDSLALKQHNGQRFTDSK